MMDHRGAESAGGGCVGAAKVIVASITSCRTAAVRNQQSEEELNRQNLLTQPAD